MSNEELVSLTRAQDRAEPYFHTPRPIVQCVLIKIQIVTNMSQPKVTHIPIQACIGCSQEVGSCRTKSGQLPLASSTRALPTSAVMFTGSVQAGHGKAHAAQMLPGWKVVRCHQRLRYKYE